MKSIWDIVHVCIAGGTVKWRCLCGKVWQFLRKLHVEYPLNLAIALLGTYLREIKTYPHKNVYTNVHSNTMYNGQKAETTQMSIN